MHFSKLLENIIVLCLFIATVGTAYIFIATLFLNDSTFSGFFTSWQFPMLLAIFIDSAFYKHINKLPY